MRLLLCLLVQIYYTLKDATRICKDDALRAQFAQKVVK